MSGTFQEPGAIGTFIVSTLPTVGPYKGAIAFVTDATSPTYLGALTGGSTVFCRVIWNGTAWLSC